MFCVGTHFNKTQILLSGHQQKDKQQLISFESPFFLSTHPLNSPSVKEFFAFLHHCKPNNFKLFVGEKTRHLKKSSRTVGNVIDSF